MKKLFALLLTVVMIFAISSCESTSSKKESKRNKHKTEKKSQDEEDDDSDNVISFTATDIYGGTVDFRDFKDAEVIMINFWEPWCGPCVGEMPELADLYEDYKADGLVIIGVYSSEGYDDDVMAIISDSGVKYPVIFMPDELKQYTTDYVPTTIFMDSHGNLLSQEPYIGSNNYSTWASIIEEYL